MRGANNIEHRRAYPSPQQPGLYPQQQSGYAQQQQPSSFASMNTDSIRSSLFATSNGPRASQRPGVQMGGLNNNSSSMGSGGRSGAPHSVGNDRMYAEQSERLMESQNDVLTARLADKVNLLKQMSIDIGVEVKEQNRFLTDMDADMENTQSFMHKTLGSLQNMINTGGSKHMCYLVGFIFAIFMLVYWLVR
jgi:blocked-early-in-transport protein 1